MAGERITITREQLTALSETFPNEDVIELVQLGRDHTNPAGPHPAFHLFARGSNDSAATIIVDGWGKINHRIEEE